MKLLFIILIMLINLEAKDDVSTKLKCTDIIKEMKILKQERDTNTMSSVGASLLSGSFGYNSSTNKEINTKIQILKLQLSDCE